MSEHGVQRVGNLVWDATSNSWTKQVPNTDTDGLSTVRISGITPVDGKLPVDTEITVEGDVIVEGVRVRSAPLTQTYPSGTFARLMENADDLVTVIQYNEPDTRTTVSGITYTSATLGTTAYETFVSGTNVLTITRTT